MKSMTLLCIIALLSGCAMTPRQKALTAGVVLVLSAGAIAAHNDGKNPAATIGPPVGLPCRPQPDGSCR